MRICIATFYNILHPGAVLQAYALHRTLVDMGHEVSIIQYPPQRDAVMSLNLSSVYATLTKTREKRIGYRQFVSEFLDETQAYHSYDELAANPPVADAYVCGSDQIWNPRVTGGRPDPAYFLGFGDPSVRRIAYAPSFGGEPIAEPHQSTMRDYLMNFDALSVRERDGQEFVEKLTGRPGELVLDPTLLRDDWDTLARPLREKDGYVLLYQLQKSPGIYAAATTLAKKLGKPLLNVDASLKFWSRPGQCVRAHSPHEWLGLFQNAAAVVTNSFHGTAFSILFRRPFYAVALTGNKAHLFHRMKGLCTNLGLGERCVKGAGKLEVGEIDWDSVSRKMCRLREDSLNYLERATS